MNHNFIKGPPRESASLQELMLYLRPKSKGELSSELRKSFTSSGAHQELEQENWGLITELGMNPVQFAQLALTRPELWDDEQIEYLETIAAGYPPGNRIIELAEDFFTDAAVPPQPEPRDEDTGGTEGEDLDPLQRHERALTALVAPTPALTPLHTKEVLPVVGDVGDDWWKKK
jgi:hypothetical protein